MVVRGGGVGDVLLTMPVLHAIKNACDGLTFVAPGPLARLAKEAGLADTWQALDGREWMELFTLGGGNTLEPILSEMDFLISYLSDPNGVFAANCRGLSEARIIQGPYRPEGAHMSDRLMEPLEALGLESSEARLRFPAGELLDGVWVAAHPGSGSERKNWSEDHWRELLESMMAETDWKILLVGGEAELGRIERLTEGVPADRVRCEELKPLWELGGLFQNCSIFVGVDSGIRHLAEAVGLPGVVIWGPSNVNEWGPRRDDWRVLTGLVETRASRVLAVLREVVSESNAGTIATTTGV